MNEYIINKLYLDDNQYVKSYYGTTGIWKKYYNIDTDFITIELDSPGSATLTAARKGDWRCDLFYSFDRKTWTPFNELHDTETGDITVTVEFTDKIYLKGDTYSGRSAVSSQYITLKVNSLHSVSGNLMSLVDNDTIRSYMFCNLFYMNEYLTDASGLILPNYTDTNCYYNMFYGCSRLTATPELPATTLATSCYNSMFYNCTSLVNAPELPATTLKQNCYSGMFKGCTSLTKTPILRASTLVSSCYSGMFNGCTSLTIATILATDVSATDCLNNIFGGIHNNCILKKIKDVDYSDYIYSDWTQTDVFYLVNRPWTDNTGRLAWHGYENKEDWTSTAWADNIENENFLMYCDSDNYVYNMLDDAKILSSWHSQFGLDDIKLYSITDTDSTQVFLPCGYGYYPSSGGNVYRIWMASYNGTNSGAYKSNLQDFITTWGYGRNSTYIASYEKKYYRYIEPVVGPQLIDYQYFTNMAVNESVEISLSCCYNATGTVGQGAPRMAAITSTGSNGYITISGNSKEDLYNSILSHKTNLTTFIFTKKSSTTATIVPKYNTSWALQSGSTTWTTGSVTYDISFPEPGDKTYYYDWVNAVNNGDCIRIAVGNNKWNTSGGATIKWATGTGGYSVWLAWKL